MLQVPPSTTPTAGSWRPVSLREAGLLMLIAFLATGVSWFLRSDGLSLTADPIGYELELAAPLIQVDPALALYDEGDYLFVDARPSLTDEFQTIPGAFFISVSGTSTSWVPRTGLSFSATETCCPSRISPRG